MTDIHPVAVEYRAALLDIEQAITDIWRDVDSTLIFADAGRRLLRAFDTSSVIEAIDNNKATWHDLTANQKHIHEITDSVDQWAEGSPTAAALSKLYRIDLTPMKEMQ